MLTQERLREIFEYNPHSGWLINRIDRNSRALAGNRAGTENERGYRQVWIDGTKYYEHRVIWLYLYGTLPPEVDHKDGVRNNNRQYNLREATRTENCYNTDWNTGESALRGANFDSERSMWRSVIQKDGRRLFLGRFNTAEEANKAYLAAAESIHKEFAFEKRRELFIRRI